MKKNLNKKGFTIVELVIVIVVIAILAAVLIPTFVSLVNKANRSADEQAVVQMNKLLEVEAIDGQGPQKIQDIKKILTENGYNHKLDPLFKGYSFAWIAEKNVIVLVENNKVVYPKEYADYDFTKVELFNVVKVGSANDIKDLANGTFANINGLNSIVLEKGMNVLSDASANTAETKYLTFNNAGDIEIDGNGNTIQGNIDVSSGTTLTLTNVTIDATNSAHEDCSAVKPTAGSVYITDTTIKGQVFGLCQNVGQAADVTDDIDCTVENSTMDAEIALYIGHGNWTFENCTFVGTVTIAGGANVTFNNCTFKAKTGVEYTDESEYTTSGSGAFVSQNAIVIIEGRNATQYESGKVTFTGCTVTNAEGADVNTTGGVNYRFCTYTGSVSGNDITVEWN
ncbi:MAG: prepilin-type N-terminal cleavage/methylation domain-containing protein [Ruminococcaceae bacterium]|nr:prepilin-type N-terminal cleavage/methylation domain-containing protein [Oscillospiraceae bacterium]